MAYTMTDDEKKQLWSKVLAEIETEVSRANYLTLFKPTTLLSFDNSTATVATPSAMIINMLQTRYVSLIKSVLDKHTKLNTTIVFVPRIVEKAATTAVGPLFSEAVNNNPEPLDASTKNLLSRSLARVRPEYTFETLAVSSSNQLAYVSSQTVANNIGGAYNPLFIYGPVGVGKTHLMQSIANHVWAKNKSKRIIYITSEEFTNDVVEAIKINDTARMKKKFRSADLLIIDDIQFLAGKDRVQEELFHTFNILIDNNAQIVLSSDRPPQEIKKFEKRLSSRFAGGLTVDIEAPDFELRTAILLIKAKKLGIELPIETAKIIAEEIQDTRSLEGALLRSITEANAKGVDITSVVTKASIQGEEQRSSRLHPDDVVKNICAFYNLKPTQLKGPKRDAYLVKPRQICMYLLKKELGISLVEIGNLLGGRDHTTVMHGIQKIEAGLSTNPKIVEEISGITAYFK
jgi:chromosomal replication initiator protein